MGDPSNPPAPTCAPAPTAVVKKKHKKRDPRSWENIIRSTASMTLEEKEQYLENIYNELYNETRTNYSNLQAREKQYTQCLRENEKVRAELTKSILARGHLESLCRELQKQNKLIKEENVARIKEEEERRRELANTFTERLNALTSLISESKDKSNNVKEESQNMTQKLTELYERLETVTRQLDLQKKLAETQAKKVEIEHEAEKQSFLAQKRALEHQLEQYEREMVLQQEKNRSLEAQVDLYKSQYTDFETTMSKSNKVFDTFKEEMSKMSKQLHTLEAERNDLKKRWQSSVNSLIVLSEQHMALSNEQGALEKRLQMLQKLCRQLQEDRSAFLKQLKDNNIEPIVSSLKNEDSKENEGEEQEAEGKELTSNSGSSLGDMEVDLSSNCTAKPTKRVRFSPAMAGDHPSPSSTEGSSVTQSESESVVSDERYLNDAVTEPGDVARTENHLVPSTPVIPLDMAGCNATSLPSLEVVTDRCHLINLTSSSDTLSSKYSDHSTRDEETNHHSETASVTSLEIPLDADSSQSLTLKTSTELSATKDDTSQKSE